MFKHNSFFSIFFFFFNIPIIYYSALVLLKTELGLRKVFFRTYI